MGSSAFGWPLQLEYATSSGGSFQVLQPASNLPPTQTSFTEGFPGPGTFYFRLRAHAACGAESVSNVVVITATAPCTAPLAPVNPSITVAGTPGAPIGGTDFLTLAWQAPTSGQAPSLYQYRINGDPLTPLAATSAAAPPRGDDSSITLYVYAQACSGNLPAP